MNKAIDIIKPIKECIQNFKKYHILVFGDIIFDVYLRGEVKRISPEAPVPILNTKEYDYRLGGGGNVALNLSNMGMQVTLASVIGKDKNGQQLIDFMSQSNLNTDGIVVSSKRKTSIKTRVIAQSQQIVRIDDEDTHVLNPSLGSQLISRVIDLKQTFDGIIISDYGKGVVNKKVFEDLTVWAKKNNIFIALDPKQRNFSFYYHIDVMTPNHFEAAENIGRSCETFDEVKSVGMEIMSKHNLQQLLITRGEKGMTLFDRSSHGLNRLAQSIDQDEVERELFHRNQTPFIYNLPTFNRSLFDVSGAGDTVIALYTAAYVASRDAYLAALIANISAGIVVSHFGTYPITSNDFMKEIENQQLLKTITNEKYNE